MSLKIFLNEIYVQHVNAPTYNLKKIRHYIFSMHFLTYVENTRSLFLAFVRIKAL